MLGAVAVVPISSFVGGGGELAARSEAVPVVIAMGVCSCDIDWSGVRGDIAVLMSLETPETRRMSRRMCGCLTH